MKRGLFILLLAAFGLQSHAKSTMYNEFSIPLASYASYLGEALDVDVSLPAGFTDLQRMCQYEPVTASGETGFTTLVGAMLQSDDGNCLVMMPDMQWRANDLWQGDPGFASELMKCQVYLTLKDEVYYVYLDQNPPLDLSKIVVSANAKKFNADTVLVSTLPTNDSIMGHRYTHRTHMVMSKVGHPVVEVSILLTDQGEKNKKKYLDKVFAAIKFGKRKGWQYDNERHHTLRMKYIGKYHEYISKFIR